MPKAEQRAYHGDIDPEDLARALVMRFNEGETQSQWMRGQGRRTTVQVMSRRVEAGDPNTAVTVHISPTDTGVTATISEQKWLGLAADMAKSGLKAWRNPLRLLNELDDIARNVRWISLRSEIWKAIDEYCQSQGSGRGAAPLLQNLVCPYCGTPNKMGSLTCSACRAPLAEVQPTVCPHCGSLNRPEATRCTNCGTSLQREE